MADPIRQLLSQTSYDADGTTTVWNFSFAGGYLDRAHVKVQVMDKVTLLVTQIPISDANFIGDYQLQLIPAVEAGQELTIYRDSPKDLPLVDFADRAALTEAALDLNAKQAIFAAAEVTDTVSTSLAAVSQVGAQVAAAEGYAVDAAGHATDAANQVLLATAQAMQANASAISASSSAQYASDSAAAAAASAESVDTAFLLNRANHTGTQSVSTLAGVLPVANGGTGVATSTGTGSTVRSVSPALTGVPTAPTAAVGTNTTQVATTAFVMSRPAGHLFQQDMWNGTRANIPAGFIPEDGQQVFDATYPEAVAAIRSGKQYAITEAAWQADPLKRNCWSLGDGSTWVRAPDNNGVQSGSIGKLYKAGDGGSLGGTAVGDAIRNITGSASAFYRAVTAGTSGAMTVGTYGPVPAVNGTSGTHPGDSATINFNASLQVPTAAENRPKTSYQCYIVRVATGVSTNGTTDLEALAAGVAGAIAEIQPLKIQSFGYGQTLQDVTASRVLGTNYTNNTGKPIAVIVSGTTTLIGGLFLGVIGSPGDVAAIGTNPNASGSVIGVSFIVPAGSIYRISPASAVLVKWQEYR